MINAQIACVAVRLGVFQLRFQTVLVVSVGSVESTWQSRNFDFHIMLSKMHDIYNYQNPNPEMPTKNGLEINVCKDDFAWMTVQRCDFVPFVNRYHGLIFAKNKKVATYYM